MTSHANCNHPATKKDRSACRKAHGVGKVHVSSMSGVKREVLDIKGPKSFAEANEQGNIDSATLDDRIRAAKRRPRAGEVKVLRMEG